MQKVVGFGGFFFRAARPADLARWYRDTLGIDLVPTSQDQKPWIAGGGPTVFAPFAADTTYFSVGKAFMLNFKVRDLAAMIAQLKAAGIEVTAVPEMPGIGKFAHLHDPEGTPIELWEPELL
jgi:predicted enzyme related to lactoylglutathione lyase